MLKHYQLGPRRPHLLALRRGLMAGLAATYLGHSPRGEGAAEAAAALAAAAAVTAGHQGSAGVTTGEGDTQGNPDGMTREYRDALQTALGQGARFQWDWVRLLNHAAPAAAAKAAAAAKKQV